MKLQYDREVDALYIELSDTSPHHNIEVDDSQGVSVDVDEAGRVVGIEVLDASQVLGEGWPINRRESALRNPQQRPRRQ